MSAFYTNAEAARLRQKAAERGETIDLLPCKDGIARPAEEKANHDRMWEAVRGSSVG